MDEYESLSHTTWDCKYHVVFIPKCRRRTLYQELRRHLGEVFRRLALQKESKVEEGHLMPDHVHMLLSIPPKHAVSQVVGLYQGQERDPHGSGLWRAQTQFRGAAFLGPGILRQHGRARRGGHPRLHPQPREGGSEAGADEPLALKNAAFGRLPNSRGRVSDPFCRFERLQPKAPGSYGVRFVKPFFQHLVVSPC